MTRIAWLLCFGLTAAAFASAEIVYANRQTWLPEMVAVHWGPTFQPDHWVARDELFWYLMLPPILMGGLTILLPLLFSWLSPRGFEPSKGNPKVANTVVVLVVLLLAGVHTVVLLEYLGKGLP